MGNIVQVILLDSSFFYMSWFWGGLLVQREKASPGEIQGKRRKVCHSDWPLETGSSVTMKCLIVRAAEEAVSSD